MKGEKKEAKLNLIMEAFGEWVTRGQKHRQF